MELNCASKLKEVGRLTEGQLALVMASFTEENQGAISQFCDVIIQTSQPRPNQNKPAKTFSNKQLAIEAVNQMEKALRVYEANDFIDDWTLSFNVGIDFQPLSLPELLQHHKQLDATEKNCDKIKLLICYEKGRVYTRFKEIYAGEFTNLCNQLILDSKTVNRYIEFFNLSSSFPRMIICGINFTDIMNLSKEIVQLLSANQGLRMRLATPLKGLTVKADLKVGSEMLPHGKEQLREFSSSYDWKSGWVLADNL